MKLERFARLTWLILACACGGGGDDDGAPAVDAGPGDPDAGGPEAIAFDVQLVPQEGVMGNQRLNFAIPTPRGLIEDADLVRVARAGGLEIDAGRRVLARWPGGSVRSVQIQVDVNVSDVATLEIEIGQPTATDALDLVPVADTLVVEDGTEGPKVWAIVAREWLAPSGVAGPLTARSSLDGTNLYPWDLCTGGSFGTGEFLAEQESANAWLYDRPTAFYRVHAAGGSLSSLQDAYREAAIYRSLVTGTDGETRIGVPASDNDLKAHYTQGMAIHYLMTGDDRFREAAENVAFRAHDLWPDPGYDGGADFWTERHAGFALLAYEWAAQVSDDRASLFAGWSDDAVPQYLALQDLDTGEEDARCFAHQAAAASEDFGYVGCSPWLSAILADGLDGYAERVGGANAELAREGLVKLGRFMARHRDAEGKPYFWVGAGVDDGEIDEFEEHWGESAYVVAMAWHRGGREDDQLHDAAIELMEATASRGEVSSLQSFNWQCRTAVMTPTFLLE